MRILLFSLLIFPIVSLANEQLKRECLDIPAKFNNGKCSCNGFSVIKITPEFKSFCLKPIVKEFQKVLSTDPRKNLTLTCGSEEKFYYAPNENIKCPTHHLSTIEENGTYRLLNDVLDNQENVNQSCGIFSDYKDKDRNTFDNPIKLEGYFSQNKNFSINAPDNFLNQCLENSGLSLKPQEKKIFISDYYQKMLRLQKGMQNTISQMRDFDSLLETPIEKDPFWSNDCASEYLTNIQNQCESLSKCKPTSNNFKHFAHKKYQLYQEYQELIRLRNRYSNGNCKRSRNKKVCLKKVAEREKINQLLQVYEHNLSFSKGNIFQESIENENTPNVLDFTNALKNQFKHDREKVISRHQELKNAAKCLNSSLYIEECEDLNSTMQSLPRFIIPSPKERTYESVTEGNALSYLEKAKCAEELRENNKELKSQAVMFGVDVALTIGTAGYYGAEVLAARGASFSAKLIQAGKTTAKVAKEMMKTPLGVARLGAITASGVNELFIQAPNDFHDLIKSCGDKIGAIPESVSPNSCLDQKNLDSVEFVHSQSDFTDCAISAAFASLNILPLVPEGFRVLKNVRKPKVSVLTKKYHDNFTPEQTIRMAQDIKKIENTTGIPSSTPKGLEEGMQPSSLKEKMEKKIVEKFNKKFEGKPYLNVTLEDIDELHEGLNAFVLMPGESVLRTGRGVRGHYHLTLGEPVMAAGEIFVAVGEDGKKYVTEIGVNMSGHFKPNRSQSKLIAEAIWAGGLDHKVDFYEFSADVTKSSNLSANNDFVFSIGKE